MALSDFLFGSTKAEPIYVNPQLNTAVSRQASTRMPEYQRLFDEGLGEFRAATRSAQQNLNRLAPQSEGQLSAAIQALSGYNPLADYERIRTGNIAAANAAARNLAGAGSAQQKLMLSRLGYAGIPTSSYNTLLTTDRVARNSLPMYDRIFANLGADAGMLGNLRFQAPNALNNAILAREGVYTRPAQLSLNPLLAAYDALGAETGALTDIANAARANFAGLNTRNNPGLLGGIAQAGNLLGGAAANVGLGTSLLRDAFSPQDQTSRLLAMLQPQQYRSPLANWYVPPQDYSRFSINVPPLSFNL